MSNRPPSERMALAFSEDAMAIASWADAHGFSEDAGALNRFAQEFALSSLRPRAAP